MMKRDSYLYPLRRSPRLCPGRIPSTQDRIVIRMKRSSLRVHWLVALSLIAASPVAAQQAPKPGAAKASTSSINIPYEKYTLPNGLTVILSEDHSTPMLAVNVMYHVGSKNEELGRT